MIVCFYFKDITLSRGCVLGIKVLPHKVTLCLASCGGWMHTKMSSYPRIWDGTMWQAFTDIKTVHMYKITYIINIQS